MLDTNICIYLIKQHPPEVLERLRKCRPETIGISSITLSELEVGVSKSSRPDKNRIALTLFLAAIEVLPYDEPVAQVYGDIRAHLEGQGTPIGALDTLIAAHALSLGCILVTNNLREFNRVPGLKLENWAHTAQLPQRK